jgi:hypothetical protein
MEIKMTQDFDVIGALTRFSVGTIDGRDAMMVIELATTPTNSHGVFGIKCRSQ